MGNDNKNKYDLLVQLLSEGDAMVCLDARHSEVDVPNTHKDNPALVFKTLPQKHREQ